MKFHVIGLHKTINGGVSSDLTLNEPHKRIPRIVLIGVTTNMPEQEVYKSL